MRNDLLFRKRCASPVTIGFPIFAGLCCLGLLSPHSEAAEEALTTEQIVQRLQAWRSSFTSVRVTWRSWHRALFVERYPDRDPDAELGKTAYTEYEFIWADWGAFRQSSSSVFKDEVVFRDGLGNDGSRAWGATTKYEDDPNHFDMIQFFRADPGRPLSSNMTMDGIYGLWNSSGLWIDARLAQSQAKLEVVRFDEKLDGASCVLLALRDPAFEVLLWLDPEHSCLPRKYYFTKPGLNGERIHMYTWTVTSFSQPDGQTWWPMSGQLWGGEMKDPFDWIATKVTFNETLAKKEFSAPTGTTGRTKIIDYENNIVTKVGVPPQPNNTAQPTTPASSVSNPNPVVAAVSGFGWRWIGVVSGILVAIGIAIRWRRGHQS